MNLSHLEPIDCPLPNLQIFLACVISGIDLIFHSFYRTVVLTASILSRVQFPSCIQVVKIQNRIEQEEVAALRLTAPEGICGEENHVTIA